VQGILYYFHPKTMYLTFDDGPSEENTRKVLEILRERNIKATFFLVGENVRLHPEVARQIVAEGHTIGIHCDNHDYDALYASVDSYVSDFEKARQTVYEVTGVETNLFRFPGGSVNAFNKKTGKAIIREMTDSAHILRLERKPGGCGQKPGSEAADRERRIDDTWAQEGRPARS